MPPHILRFGVFNGAGLRAATWKCWSPHGKEDVYLTCRELEGVLKASLHESGSWHIAYNNKFFDEKVRQEDKTEKGRFLKKWKAPPPIAPGTQLAVRIVTPYGSVCTPHNDIPNIIQIPNPAEGNAVEIDLLIIEPTVNLIPEWPGKDNMNTSLVGSFQLPSGRTVWVVYWEIPIPTSQKQLTGQMRYFAGSAHECIKGDELKVLAFGNEPDGSKALYDYKVSIERLDE
jgi:hypothetical protein